MHCINNKHAAEAWNLSMKHQRMLVSEPIEVCISDLFMNILRVSIDPSVETVRL